MRLLGSKMSETRVSMLGAMAEIAGASSARQAKSLDSMVTEVAEGSRRGICKLYAMTIRFSLLV